MISNGTIATVEGLDGPQAQASIARLSAQLSSMPAAGERSKTGDPGIADKLDQWSARIAMGDMAPAALPDLLDWQAPRYKAHPEIARALRHEAGVLRRMRGDAPYGAPWYFGRRRAGLDD